MTRSGTLPYRRHPVSEVALTEYEQRLSRYSLALFMQGRTQLLGFQHASDSFRAQLSKVSKRLGTTWFDK